MKILIVSRNYHPFIGGVETQVRMIAHDLARRHEVEIAATNFRNGGLPMNRFVRRLAVGAENVIAPRHLQTLDAGVPAHQLHPPASERALYRALYACESLHSSRLQAGARHLGYRLYRAAYLPKLRELVRGKDVVHTTAHDYLGWVTEEAARAENVPIVISTYVHPGQYGDDPDNVAFYNRADAVVSLLASDKRKLVDLGVHPHRIFVSGVAPLLPNSTDPKGFRIQHGLGDRPMVLFVGRHEEYKGPLALLDAAPAVWAVRPDTHFLFIGPADNTARQWFNARKDPRISYLGLVSEQEKADALAACDLFCMPSLYEVLPAVYLEAWSYKKAVIGGKAYGLPELIDGNGAGVTVEQTPQTIAEGLLQLLCDDARRRLMGEKGYSMVQRRFSKSAVVSALEAVYAQVCSPQAAQPTGTARAV